MDKELTVPKWVLINWLKIPQCPEIHLPVLSAQLNQKVWDFGEKRLHWAYVEGCANKDSGLFYQSPGDLKGVMIKSVITTLMSPGL